MSERALFEVFPALSERVSLCPLGDFPTPVETAPELEAVAGARPGSLYLKRDDLSSKVFGGNKVRTLEVFFGAARRASATHVFSTGAFGSNHAVATVLHAPQAGLSSGAILYPQPPSFEALVNARATAALASRFVALPHWSTFPFGVAFAAWNERRRGHRPFVMPPGGATPLGALGYVNGALELARQIERGTLPHPVRVVVPGGSGCTTAGLLAGFALAARLGIGFSESKGRRAPEILSVRVTPWPVTSPYRLAHLAERTSRWVATLARDESLAEDHRSLARRLRVDGRFLGRGYGYATPDGEEAIATFRHAGGPTLETTYSAKAAAGLLRSLRESDDGPVVFWTTCSAVPAPARALPADTPRALVRWVDRTARALGEGAAQP
ncbi:MAG TPA: pyridoxal-phosphate dependent enzyme [Polyangiaceae bacterium]|nr:pyridoxal-phosphate dependent enzyme [Polyangiaceae bacterium]